MFYNFYRQSFFKNVILIRNCHSVLLLDLSMLNVVPPEEQMWVGESNRICDTFVSYEA